MENVQTARQELVQDGGRQQTIGHHGNQRNQWVESRSTAWTDAGARTPGRREKQRTRGWQRPRKKGVGAPPEAPHETRIFIEDFADGETSGTNETSVSATSSTSGTGESGRSRRRTPTPRPTRSPSEVSATSEMSVSSVGSWTRNFCAMKRWFALQIEEEMFFNDTASEMC